VDGGSAAVALAAVRVVLNLSAQMRQGWLHTTLHTIESEEQQESNL
jgi:hypothetical protein